MRHGQTRGTIVKPFMRMVTAVAVTAVLAGCDFNVFDNYDEPNATLTGRLVYQGNPVGLRSNGVQLQLWQPGYELNQSIPIYVGQDGTFSARLFDGDYRLNLVAGNGPWLDSPDTIQVQVRGEAQVDVPVMPYYTIQNPDTRFVSGAIESTFTIGSVTTSRAVEYVGLYVSTTSFVDRNNMSVRLERPRSAIPSLAAPITLSVTLPPNLAQRNDVHARIGVKTVGVAELLYSPVEKITF